MSCAPRFNYLLQALPLKIPIEYFHQFNMLCNKFIWNGKQPRLKLKRLQKPTESGGLGVPNLSLYHCAFSLRHLTHWALPPERAPPWIHLENYLRNPLPPLHLATTKLSPKFQKHPIVSFLQYVWKRAAAILGFNSHLHSQASIWLNPSLCIGKSPFIWNLWVEKGIFTLYDLYEGGALKSFEDLRALYGLPQNQFWRYLQLRHLLCHVFGSPTFPPSDVDWSTQVLSTLGKDCKASVFYAMLLKNSNNDLPTLKRTWEIDLNMQFSDIEWANILRNGKKLSRELRTRLVQFKILNRLYWTPHKMYRAKLRPSLNCWKCLNILHKLSKMVWLSLQNFLYWEIHLPSRAFFLMMQNGFKLH
uniref:Reverse transcriptase zinc-binding domain-containing protein n=1 Tax=Acanthochromis polyacanthus TaxID=80966 RepID=A0A3Q1G672_9TELE